MERRYFGTDGIRGTVGTSPIDPEFMMKLGWAAGRVLAREGEGKRKVVIGKDTRVSGYLFESALQAGLVAAGVDIRLLGPMPTPAIAYLTRTLHAKAGIVISASHNPFEDNGIKFFSHMGTKLPDEIEHEIEAEIDKPMTTVSSSELGRAARVHDAGGRYIEFCKSTIPLATEFRGLKVVVDCANGATYHVGPPVFKELGAHVVAIGNQPDGININLECGSTHPRLLQEKVLHEKADFGVAFDGDGDRVIMVDDKGEVVDGDELLFIIAESRRLKGELQGGVVGTLMTNFGLEQALQRNKVPFERANVGDRYVLESLKNNDWKIGGESSGHIICLDRTTTGDGICAALQVVNAMVDSGRTLHELKMGMRKYPQTMINVRVSEKPNINGNETIANAVKKVEDKLEGNGRVLLRPSGTEPVVRVMVEGNNPAEVSMLAKELAAEVEKALKK
ncbi:MAG: phosphoglucosamine mutase [Gammaproteobacteria bacterium]|nr:phosphoglucosamine mutase [Gammaproteobacteria bacterium]